MPKSYLDVQDEYNAYQLQNPDHQITLPDFAKQLDAAQGTPGERGEAYSDAWYKRANAVVDRGFWWTHIPQLTGAALGGMAGLVDQGLGTHIEPTVTRLGEDLPRTLVESLATIPEAASGVGAPVAAATWMNRANQIRKALGYGGAALSGYAQTESPLGAAIGAGSMYGMNKLLLPEARGGLDVGGQAANAIRDRLGVGQVVEGAAGGDLSAAAPELVAGNPLTKNVIPLAGAGAAEAGTMGVLNEATRQAQMSVGPNAQPLSSPERNPFTEENVAGQVVGALPFAGQAAMGLHGASRFDPRAVKGMHDWITERHKAINADAADAVEGNLSSQDVQDLSGQSKPLTDDEQARLPGLDVKKELQETPKWVPDPQKQLIGTVQAHLQALKMATDEGRQVDVDMLSQTIKGLLDTMGMKQDDVPAFKDNVKEVDAQSREMPARDVPGLVDLTQKVNSLIDFYNENRAKIETGEIPAGPTSGEKQAWHPEARDPSVVQRLQGKGLLPKIDEAWLKEKWNATFSDTGDPLFADDVLGQKIANHLLDNLPEALKQEAATPAQVDTPVSPKVQAADAREKAFFGAIAGFSPEVQGALLTQTLKFRSMPGTVNSLGRQVSPYGAWMQAVLTAAQTYNPLDGTIKIYRGGKLQKTTINSLWSKDYKPIWSPVPLGEGGKGIRETNLEGMTSPTDVGGTEDEELAKAQLAESGGAGLAGMKPLGVASASAEESLTGGTAKPVEDTIAQDVPAPTRDKFLPQAEQFRKTVDSMSPAQTWALVQGVIGGNARNTSGDSFRAANAKLALQAVAEHLAGQKGDQVGPAGQQLIDAYKAAGYKDLGVSPRRQLGVILNSFFKAQVETAVPKELQALVKSGDLTRTEANKYAWIAKATERVLNPKAVEAAKAAAPGGVLGRDETSINEQTHDIHAGYENIKTGDIVVLRDHASAQNTIPEDSNFRQVYVVAPKSLSNEIGAASNGEYWVKKNELGPKDIYPVSIEAAQGNKGDIYQAADYQAEMARQSPQLTGKAYYDNLVRSSNPSLSRTEVPTMVNNPAPGAFETDVYRTFRSFASKTLGEQGYAGTLRDLLTEMAVKTMQTTTSPENLDLYRIADGPRGLAVAGEDLRGKVGVKFDEGAVKTDTVKWMHDVMNTFQHELAHIDDMIAMGMLPKPDAFSQDRQKILRNLAYMAENMSPLQRNAYLQVLDRALRPPQFTTLFPEKETGLVYGSSRPEEFTAVVQSLVTQSVLFGPGGKMKSAMDLLDYSPVEVQDFARGTYRTIRDVMQAAKQSLADPAVRQGTDLPANINRYVLSEVFDGVVQAARYGSKIREGTLAVKAAQEWLANLSEGAAQNMPQGMTAATMVTRTKETQNYVPGVEANVRQMAEVTDAVEQMKSALGMPAKLTNKDVKPGFFFDWLVPFKQVMWNMERQGVRMAAPIADLLLTTEEAIHRRRSAILAPFLVKDAAGNVKWNQDNPFVYNVTPAVRDGFNKVSQWQRENAQSVTVNGQEIVAHLPMFVQGPDGVIVPNQAHPKNAFAAWAEMSKGMSPDTLNAVMSGSVSADQVGTTMNAYSQAVVREYTTQRVARMLMSFNRKLGAMDAHNWADRVMQGFESGDMSKTGLTPEDVQAIGGFLTGENGPLQMQQKLAAFGQASTGYRTEQLPHDWILQYKNADGEIKYASAPSEKQATYVMDQIQRRGGTMVGDNPVNKNDLRSKFQNFDNPASVVEQAAFLEQKAWERAVEQIRATRGDDVADELQMAYRPMVDSLRDVTSQGFRKFVESSSSKVDREQYDYLDGMLSRAGRLAASGAYHTHGGMKDLFLADPSVRQFPSFAQKVNEQWLHMVTPQDNTTGRFKAISAAYYLGANLSSIAIRLTHSLSTFVPVLVALDDKGGPVAAWQGVFKAIGHAYSLKGEDIESTANAALKRNPKSWDETDTRAVMLQRAYEGGVIGNNIFTEIFSPKDFRTQQNAAFGMADYGKTSAFDRATNGLYLLSQMSTSLYGWAARQNDKIGFLAGVNQGMDKGLEGDALYNYARSYWQLASGGGGKENMPGIVAKAAKDAQWERSAVGLAYTLQHYGATLVGLYAQLGKDAIWGSKALSAQEKRQAQKAFLTLLTTQTAAAGALGLPFVGAAMVTLQNSLGIPVQQYVRQGLASLGANDDDVDAPSWTKGSAIAETLMNGLSNQVFGLDLSARIGVGGLFGVSSYRGFNGADMGGPAASIIDNFATAASLYGQNKPWQAVTSLVPQAFKDAMGLAASKAKYGDYSIRDAGDNLLYTPSPAQAVGYMAGFRPQEVSQKRQQADLLQFSNKRFDTLQEVRLNKLAEDLIEGNPGPARQYAQQLRQVDPTVQIDDSLRAVMERAVQLTQERDLLASGPRLNKSNQMAIASTFPQASMPRRSEVALEGLRTQLAAKLGAPQLMPDEESWTRSAIADGLIQRSQGRMPRAQALAMVRMMGL